jgi:hypothetical protein
MSAKAAHIYTTSELAEYLRLSPVVVRGLVGLKRVFAGAWKENEERRTSAEDDGWRIPKRAVESWLGRQMEPLFTIEEAADALGLHRVTVQKATADYLRGDKAGFATVELLLPGTTRRSPRITLSELQRHVKPSPLAQSADAA